MSWGRIQSDKYDFYHVRYSIIFVPLNNHKNDKIIFADNRFNKKKIFTLKVILNVRNYINNSVWILLFYTLQNITQSFIKDS